METSPFGQTLRQWRRRRGVSQLALAGLAGTTTRHLSYLETGRSRPSRGMVLRLAAGLDVPLRERNRLLQLAGLPGAFPEGDLAAADLAPFTAAIDRLLARHEPYPGLALDRHWNIVRSNRGARLLMPEGNGNAARLAIGPWRGLVDNWDDVVLLLLDRIEGDLVRAPDDPALHRLHTEVVSAAANVRRDRRLPSGRVACPAFRFGEQVIRTLTIVAVFQSSADVTLDEIRVELVYPQDADAETFFRSAGDSLGDHPDMPGAAVPLGPRPLGTAPLHP